MIVLRQLPIQIVWVEKIGMTKLSKLKAACRQGVWQEHRLLTKIHKSMLIYNLFVCFALKMFLIFVAAIDPVTQIRYYEPHKEEIGEVYCLSQVTQVGEKICMIENKFSQLLELITEFIRVCFFNLKNF